MDVFKAEFTTRDRGNAIEYIRLHLEEGYYVKAYIVKRPYVEYMPMYKIEVTKVNDEDATDE